MGKKLNYNYDAWERNALGFIRSKGMEREFSDWCGGWPMPPSQPVAALTDALRGARAQMARIIGDHNAPSDCYATGPLTGDAFTDLVSCPSCEGEAMLAEIDKALAAWGDGN